jgi:hypothetical protein
VARAAEGLGLGSPVTRSGGAGTATAGRHSRQAKKGGRRREARAARGAAAGGRRPAAGTGRRQGIRHSFFIGHWALALGPRPWHHTRDTGRATTRRATINHQPFPSVCPSRMITAARRARRVWQQPDTRDTVDTCRRGRGRGRGRSRSLGCCCRNYYNQNTIYLLSSYTILLCRYPNHTVLLVTAGPRRARASGSGKALGWAAGIPSCPIETVRVRWSTHGPSRRGPEVEEARAEA